MGTSPLRRLNPFRKDRRRWGRRHNPDGTMSLVEHLYELRYRLGLATAMVAVGGVIGFLWFEHTVWPLPTLGQVMTEPYCSLPASMRFSPEPGRCQLLQTKPFEVFSLRLKVGIAAGVVLVSPVWLYQLWAFVTPGLYARERRFASVFVSVASVLFVAGAVLAYFVVPQGLKFMVGFGAGQFFTALTGSDYIGFVLLLLVIFGISFELPLLLVMLNRAGVVSYARLVSWWRGIVFGLFLFAAIATPGQDPISMLMLAVALSLLFGVAMLICRVHDRGKARGLEEAGMADPDEPSRVDVRPSRLDDVDEQDMARQTTGRRSDASGDSDQGRHDDVT